MVETIHDNCDHGMIFSIQDPILVSLWGPVITRNLRLHKAHYYDDLPGWKIILLDVVPTAENLARVWYKELEKSIDRFFEVNYPDVEPPKLIRVDVRETPNCIASYPSEAPGDHQHRAEL